MTTARPRESTMLRADGDFRTPRPRHEPWIDWLRALASLAVVFFHLNEVRTDHTSIYGFVAAHGYLSVPVFFVVSGYCVMLSSLDRPPPLDFLFKRYMRVLPPYWASLAIVLAVVIAREVLTGQNDVTVLPKGLTAVLATLTLTTKPVTSIPTINWVYWTLSYELAFYGVMALALVKRTLFTWVMLAVSVACLILPLYPMAKLPGLFFLDYWPLFALGVGLALVIDRRTFSHVALLGTATLGLFLALPVVTVVAGGLTAASIWLVRAAPLIERRLHSRFFAFLGSISYSLYLIHVPIGVYAVGHLLRLGSTISQPARMLTDALAIGTCIVAAWGFNLAIERPAQRLAKTLRARHGRGDTADISSRAA